MRKVLTRFSHPSGKRVDVYLIGRRYHAETVSPTGKIINKETFDDTLALNSYLEMIAGDGYQEVHP